MTIEWSSTGNITITTGKNAYAGHESEEDLMCDLWYIFWRDQR